MANTENMRRCLSKGALAASRFKRLFRFPIHNQPSRRAKMWRRVANKWWDKHGKH